MVLPLQGFCKTVQYNPVFIRHKFHTLAHVEKQICLSVYVCVCVCVYVCMRVTNLFYLIDSQNTTKINEN